MTRVTQPHWLSRSVGAMVVMSLMHCPFVSNAETWEDDEFESEREETRPVRFVSLDRSATAPFVDVSLSAALHESTDRGLALRSELAGQFALTPRLGAYVGVPYAYASIEEERVHGPVSYEAGVVYVGTDASTTQWHLRGGMLRGGRDRADSSKAAGATFNVRLTDVAGSFGDISWLRLSASPVFGSDDLFFRFDFGLDKALDAPSSLGFLAVLRANAALGHLVGDTLVSIELANVVTVGSGIGFRHTLGVGVRHPISPRFDLYGAVGRPLNEASGVSMTLTTGVTATL